MTNPTAPTPTFSTQDILMVLALKELERGWYLSELTKAQAKIDALTEVIAKLAPDTVQ